MTYNVDGMEVNVTLLNETISRVSVPRHYHTKSFVQYAYWLVALLQVSVLYVSAVCVYYRSVCVYLLTASGFLSRDTIIPSLSWNMPTGWWRSYREICVCHCVYQCVSSAVSRDVFVY